jgi:crotonobetainyl-CoA:carnitine CoA-transferase CaiB-like acyl-CoA transferase
MGGPLSGVRVLDFTWAQQGPYATVMLSDMGAEIIKIEPRRGELGRNSTSGAANAPKPGSYFVAHDRGKRSVTLDITTPRGREVVMRFAERVDAVVNNMRPTVMERLGLGYEALAAVNPRIVYASASTFGPLGELAALPGFDIIGQAAGGIMTKTGHEGDPPTTAGAAIADQVGAIYLCSGILAGLVQAARTGRGVQVDSSLYGAQIGLQSWEITTEAMLGTVSGRAGSGHPLISPTSSWGTYPTADGAIVLGGINGERFATLCGLLGLGVLAERYPTDAERAANIETIRKELQGRFVARTTEDCMRDLRAAGIPTGRVQSYTDILRDPQARVNGYITELEHPVLGTISVAGSPLQFGRAPTVPQGPPPELGDSTEAYLEELGYSWDEISALRQAEII